MWTIELGWIKGLAIGLSYEDQEEVLEETGLDLAIILELGFFRILFGHQLPSDDEMF